MTRAMRAPPANPTFVVEAVCAKRSLGLVVTQEGLDLVLKEVTGEEAIAAGVRRGFKIVAIASAPAPIRASDLARVLNATPRPVKVVFLPPSAPPWTVEAFFLPQQGSVRTGSGHVLEEKIRRGREELEKSGGFWSSLGTVVSGGQRSARTLVALGRISRKYKVKPRGLPCIRERG